MREYLISILNRAEHIIKIKKKRQEGEESGGRRGGCVGEGGGS